MALFWYPELNDKLENNGRLDKAVLVSSYIHYFLDRTQSMFKYSGLPETIPQKWFENLLQVNGSCVIIPNGDKGLIATRCGIGGEPDVYYIPTKCIVTNPYAEPDTNRTYTRNEDCILVVNDTYATGLLPLIKKYSIMLAENDITLNIASIMARASFILSANDDKTKDSAKLFIKHLFDGELDIIGESSFLAGNSEHALTVNEISKSHDTITHLIEYHQYLKASFYNELGLQANYNMKRESINSGESQLNEDMLHPLIDDMLRERKEGVERINNMFGTNISVDFNSAWELNQREQVAAIETIENAAETPEETPAETLEETPAETPEETPAETPAETPSEIVLTDDQIEQIAEDISEEIIDQLENEGAENV